MEGFDPDTDQLIPTPNNPRRPGAGAGAGGGGIGIRPRPGAGGPIDDINDFLGSVTGGLWPDGGAAVPAGGKAEEGRGERVSTLGWIGIGVGRDALLFSGSPTLDTLKYTHK